MRTGRSPLVVFASFFWFERRMRMHCPRTMRDELILLASPILSPIECTRILRVATGARGVGNMVDGRTCGLSVFIALRASKINNGEFGAFYHARVLTNSTQYKRSRFHLPSLIYLGGTYIYSYPLNPNFQYRMTSTTLLVGEGAKHPPIDLPHAHNSLGFCSRSDSQ